MTTLKSARWLLGQKSKQLALKLLREMRRDNPQMWLVFRNSKCQLIEMVGDVPIKQVKVIISEKSWHALVRQMWPMVMKEPLGQ